MPLVKLGDSVRDSISGFEGVVTARSEQLYSTPKVFVEACLPGDDGRVLPGEWFDEARVETIVGARHAVRIA